MKRTFFILVLILIQNPLFAYNFPIRRNPHMYFPTMRYNHYQPIYQNQYYYPNYSPNYRTTLNPFKRIKQYFYGTPTSYTINTNQNDPIELFLSPTNNGYNFNNRGYFIRNTETSGSGMVTIIND